MSNTAATASGNVDAHELPGATIVVPAGVTLTSYFDRNRADLGESPAYRFIDYSQDPDGRVIELTWNELWSRVCAIGARLQQVTKPGDRVAILAPQGLEYVVGFFGAVHAGNVAIPLFAPTLSGHGERLAAVLADGRPAAVLTTTAAAESVRTFIRTLAPNERPRMIAVDAIPATLGATFTAGVRDTDDVAYLQYTSGSTRTPAGVEITHRAVYTNAMQMILHGGLNTDVQCVSWLPLYHDMGLMMVVFTAFFGAHVTLMDPMAFLRRPYRWIKQLGIAATDGRTMAAAPNFAFELTAQRGLPPKGPEAEALDLSNVVCLLNGSEPVTMSAIEQFTNAFAPYGLPATVVKPSYGMAEATLSVASIAHDAAASAVFLDREQLGAGRAVVVAPTAPGAVAHVSCGQPITDQWAVIANADGAEVKSGCTATTSAADISAARTRHDGCSATSCNPGSIPGATPRALRTTDAGLPPVIWAFISTASCTSRAGSKTSSSSMVATTTRTTSKPRSANLRARSAPAMSPRFPFPPTSFRRAVAPASK
jgi:acyl-CoA synthetase (AMP-forming)/AMP-acid ligase II